MRQYIANLHIWTDYVFEFGKGSVITLINNILIFMALGMMAYSC